MARFVALGLLVTLTLAGCAASSPEGPTIRSHGASVHEDPCVEGEEGCPVDPPPCVEGEEGCPPVDPPVCVENEALALQPLDVSALDASKALFNARCARGFTWCSLTPLLAYTYPTCLEAEPTLDQLVALALAETEVQDQRRDFSYPETFDRVTLRTGSLLASQGPELLDDIDAFAGATVLEARGFEEEVRCHNCHDFLVRYILVYPATRTVIVLDGSHGYDS